MTLKHDNSKVKETRTDYNGCPMTNNQLEWENKIKDFVWIDEIVVEIKVNK